MSILRLIFVFSLVSMLPNLGLGQPLPNLVTPDYPPGRPNFEPADTSPADAVPVSAAPLATAPAARELPTQQELVSVLKRNLPLADEPIEMKDAPDWFQNLMQRIVRENVPDKYVHDKDWGNKDRRWDGLDIRRKSRLRLTTKRKWKEVNHGTWKRYEITQIDPAENLTMRIENVHDAGHGKVAFEVSLASRLHVFARTAKWTKGVKLYSISADADANVGMRIWCQVGMKLGMQHFPPDVLLVPTVTRAELDVTDFRLERISNFDGPVVKQLSRSAHKVLLDKIAEKRDRLPEKINRQIAKNEDKMRLSLSEFASNKWNALTGGSSSKAGERSATVAPTKPKPESPLRDVRHRTAVRARPQTDDGQIDRPLLDLVPQDDKSQPSRESLDPVLTGPQN